MTDSIRNYLDEALTRAETAAVEDTCREDVARLVLALSTVLHVHQPKEVIDLTNVKKAHLCVECSKDRMTKVRTYPCPTVRAITEVLPH